MSLDKIEYEVIVRKIHEDFEIRFLCQIDKSYTNIDCIGINEALEQAYSMNSINWRRDRNAYRHKR